MRSQMLAGICLTLVVAAAGLTGCGSRNSDSAASPAASLSAPTAAVTPQATAGAGSAAETSSPTAAAEKIHLFFADKDGEKLMERETSLALKQGDANSYLAVLKALQKAPSDQEVALSAGVVFHSATLVKGLFTMDISIPAESQLGSGGEELLLKAWKQTLFQFQDIQAINIKVDGQEPESLMGHLDLPHPIHR